MPWLSETLYDERALRAVRRVLEGKFYLSEKMATLMAEKFAEGGPPATGSMVEPLSDRELEVFQPLRRALSTRQIADELHIGFKTVQAFRARIIEELGLSGATELLREAIRWHDSQNLK